jgi:integrase
MPRRAKGLTAATVQKAKLGRYFDGDGLVLTVRGPQAKFWTLRFSRGGKLREMGLGPAVGRRAVSLADARRKARELFDAHQAGADPMASKIDSRAAVRANAVLAPNFQKCAIDYIEAHRSEWTNEVHAAQWETTLREYAYPKIGHLPVNAIEVAHVLDVLQPIWLTKWATARKLRARVEQVLARAKVLKFRDGENPARWRENLDKLLPKRSKKDRQPKHHAAMPWRTLGDFMAELREVDSVVARALEFTILTCARTDEVRQMPWSEIDLAERLWVVPGSRMKMGKEHRVPLSPRVVEILQQRKRDSNGSNYVFSISGNKPLGHMSLLRMLQVGMGRHSATVHGFRSAFSDWCSESTNFAAEVREMALAHAVSDAVEAAYRRGDLLQKRIDVMTHWSEFCAKPSSTDSATVTPIRKKHGAA